MPCQAEISKGILMRAFALSAAAAIALAVPSVAMAEEKPAKPVDPAAQQAAMAEATKTLQDPEFQEQAAQMTSMMMRALLDIPVGPMADAMNRATGGKMKQPADPTATLREMAPKADMIPDQVEDKMPMMLQAMGGMAEGMQAMMPAMREMAERMKTAFPQMAKPKAKAAQ
jgi:hypothetical protein